LTEKLNETFGAVVFTQFFLSAVHLCVLGFQLVMYDNIPERIGPATFALTIIIQLFIYSYGGQIVLNASEKAAENLYQLDRGINIISARTKKPTPIKAIFFKADLPAFVSVMNATGSLITVLKSFTK
jgi:hypothetical protein